MTYIIETFQDGKQLLGSDFSRYVHNVKTSDSKKVWNAIEKHKQYVNSLTEIKPYLKNGFSVFASKIN